MAKHIHVHLHRTHDRKARDAGESESPDVIKEAARKAGMSVEDYLAQRKKAHSQHFRELQKREMEI